MKKLCVLLLVLSLSLSLAACGKENTVQPPEQTAAPVTEETIPEETVDETPVQEETEEDDGILQLEEVTEEHLTQKTLPEENVWLKETDQISLVAAIEEKDIYMYCLHNGHPWGGKGVILQTAEGFQTYPIWCLIKYKYPLLESRDMDGDGEEELVCIMGRNGGTGLSISDLYIFEPDSEGYTCLTLQTQQMADLVNEQLTFEMPDERLLVARQPDGTEIEMAAGKEPAMFVDHIKYEAQDGVITLRTSVQVMEEDGQLRFLCDYVDDPAIDKDLCAAADFTYKLEAEVIYDGTAFSLQNVRIVEIDPLA